MSRDPRARLAATAPLLPAAAAVLLLLAAARWPLLAPAGALPPALPGLVLAVLAAAGALHRPLGGRGLGAGAAALPPLLVLAGAVPAAWAAAVAVAAAQLGRVALRRRLEGVIPAAGATAAVTAAGTTAVATLAAGLVWRLAGAATPLDPTAPRLTVAAVASAVTYWLVAAALAAVGRVLGRPEGGGLRRLLPRRGELAPELLAAAAWGWGVAAAVAGDRLGWGLAALLVAAPVLGAAEAARSALLHAAAERRLAGLGLVRRAGRRMNAPGRETAAVVDRIRAECANVVGCRWFQLELAGAGGRLASWFAGPDGVLHEGEPAPEPYPPPLPGVHRRGDWRLLERSLGGDDEALARLRLWCDPRLVDRRDVELLEALLPQMASSLHQALLDREAREDPLTGAAVRRVLDRRLARAYESACETGGSFALVLCDLDHFKRINDSHGHGAGDRVLAAASAALAAAKRNQDLLARYGGEEFALLLEPADGETALAVAERMRQRVEEIELEADGAALTLTVSAGVAAFPELHVKTPGELLLLADAALYEAKERGRNRCLLHLGRGRFRHADGSEVETDEPSPPVEPPRLFA